MKGGIYQEKYNSSESMNPVTKSDYGKYALIPNSLISISSIDWTNYSAYIKYNQNNENNLCSLRKLTIQKN